MRRVLALAAVLALVPASLWSQSYYNTGTGTTQFTTTNPGIVTVQQTKAVPVLGSVAVTAMPPVALSGVPAVTISGIPTVAIAQPSVAPGDCSVTLTSAGTPYQVLPLGTTRAALILQNVSAANIGVSFTTAAPAIGAAGTFTLAAGAFLPVPPGVTHASAVWAVGSASAQGVACTLFN
jgi:hypothetical protein